jgi:hypothetical protein
MGYAGNKEPQFIMPSAIAVKETAKVRIAFFDLILISGSHYLASTIRKCMYGTVYCYSVIAVSVPDVFGCDKFFYLTNLEP